MNRLRITVIFFCMTSMLLLLFTGLLQAEENPYDQALRAYHKKDFKKAVMYLSEYIANKPDPYAYYLLGYAHYKLKNHAESVRYFEEAYVLDPNISPIPQKK